MRIAAGRSDDGKRAACRVVMCAVQPATPRACRAPCSPPRLAPCCTSCSPSRRAPAAHRLLWPLHPPHGLSSLTIILSFCYVLYSLLE